MNERYWLIWEKNAPDEKVYSIDALRRRICELSNLPAGILPVVTHALWTSFSIIMVDGVGASCPMYPGHFNLNIVTQPDDCSVDLAYVCKDSMNTRITVTRNNVPLEDVRKLIDEMYDHLYYIMIALDAQNALPEAVKI